MNAGDKLRRAHQESVGYIELAHLVPQGSKLRRRMEERAIEAVDILEDDEFVDQLRREDEFNERLERLIRLVREHRESS